MFLCFIKWNEITKNNVKIYKWTAKASASAVSSRSNCNNIALNAIQSGNEEQKPKNKKCILQRKYSSSSNLLLHFLLLHLFLFLFNQSGRNGWWWWWWCRRWKTRRKRKCWIGRCHQRIKYHSSNMFFSVYHFFLLLLYLNVSVSVVSLRLQHVGTFFLY